LMLKMMPWFSHISKCSSADGQVRSVLRQLKALEGSDDQAGGQGKGEGKGKGTGKGQGRSGWGRRAAEELERAFGGLERDL